MKASSLSQQVFDELLTIIARMDLLEEKEINDIAKSLVRETCGDADLAYLGQDLAAALIAFSRNLKS